MSWFNVCDKFWAHPKTLAAGDRAIGAWVRAGSYLSGHPVAMGVLSECARKTLRISPKVAAKLVECGLWERVEDGWLFHDWQEFRPVRSQTKEYEREKKRRQRADVSRGHFRDPGPTPPFPTLKTPSPTPSAGDNPPAPPSRPGAVVAVAFAESSNGRWCGTYGNDPRSFDSVAASISLGKSDPGKVCELFWQQVKAKNPGPTQLAKMAGALIGEANGASSTTDPYANFPRSGVRS